MDVDRLRRPITVDRIRVIDRDFRMRYEELRGNEERFREALLDRVRRNEELVKSLRELRDVTNELACLGE